MHAWICISPFLLSPSNVDPCAFKYCLRWFSSPEVKLDNVISIIDRGDIGRDTEILQ